jgi:hypothetical protein
MTGRQLGTARRPVERQRAAYLSSAADLAVVDACALEHAALSDLRINTDGRTSGEVADAIIAKTGWPTRPDHWLDA